MAIIPSIDLMSFLATFEHDDVLVCTEGVIVYAGLIIGLGLVVEVTTVSIIKIDIIYAVNKFLRHENILCL